MLDRWCEIFESGFIRPKNYSTTGQALLDVLSNSNFGLDSTLWQWYVYLPKNVLDLAGCHEGFYFTKEIILPLPSLVVFKSLLGLLILPSLVADIFLRMHQIVDWVTPDVLALCLDVDFFDGFILFFKPNDGLLDLASTNLWSCCWTFQEQLPNTGWNEITKNRL